MKQIKINRWDMLLITKCNDSFLKEINYIFNINTERKTLQLITNVYTKQKERFVFEIPAVIDLHPSPTNETILDKNYDSLNKISNIWEYFLLSIVDIPNILEKDSFNKLYTNVLEISLGAKLGMEKIKKLKEMK